MYYFAWWHYGPKLVKPWYLSTVSTLLCVLCNKESNLLKVWRGWHCFCLYSDLISHTQTDTGHTGTTRLHIYINIHSYHLLRAHSSYLHYNGWIKIIDTNIYFTEAHYVYFSKFDHLQSIWVIFLLIRLKREHVLFMNHKEYW